MRRSIHSLGVHALNCFTCSPYIPSGVDAGTLCLLIEKPDGLVLVDTGPGLEDCAHKLLMHRIFEAVTRAKIVPEETAVRQIERLGFSPEDVSDIVLTHMHFDHCGGIPDFPHARVHVYRREYEAFTGQHPHWLNAAYMQRHIAHLPHLVLYDESPERWYAFPAVRLDLEPEMWFVPLHGHTQGHCGIAIRLGSVWWFHLGDAAPLQFESLFPSWLERLVLGNHYSMLRQFKADHPDIRITTGHMRLSFFEDPDHHLLSDGSSLEKKE